MRFTRVVLGVLAFLVVVVLLGPFLVPIRPLEGLLPAEQLADPDSKFMELRWGDSADTAGRIRVHYKIAGSGAPLIVLLHGFAANTFTWRYVIGPLSAHGTVVAYDRPASGLTERPVRGEWQGANPYSADAQADQLAALIEALGFERAILVGNSAGGTIAMHTYLRHPERVQALVLVDAAIYTGGGAPDWIKPILRTPQIDRLGVLVARSLLAQGDRLLQLAWHDPTRLRPEDIEGYRKAAQVVGWDRALWEFTLASRNLRLSERLRDVQVRTLVITGDDDRIVPTEESLRLARELRNAELVVIPQCGHVPQEECPEAFLAATIPFLGR